MAKITLVAAMARNRTIGIKNELPWRLPDDLKHFKALTLDKTIVMGRKTWESLPGLLPRRRHLVISRNADYQADGAQVVGSIAQAIAAVGEDDVLIVGGANLYAQCLPLADEMQLTLIDAEIDGDAFFPEWSASDWVELAREHHEADDRHALAFDFVHLKKSDATA